MTSRDQFSIEKVDNHTNKLLTVFRSNNYVPTSYCKAKID